MKKYIRSKSLFLDATLFGTILFVSATAPAQNILQTVTQGSGTNWNEASWGGPPAAVPTSGNNYETPSGFVARTPNAVSYTHLDVYKRQDSAAGVADISGGIPEGAGRAARFVHGRNVVAIKRGEIAGGAHDPSDAQNAARTLF